MRGSGNCWFYLYLSLLSPNLPYSTPINPPHSFRMCHKFQFLEEVRSDNALFLHCLLSLIMNFLKERTMTCIFCCLLTCLHRVKPMRSAQEIATKQSGLMPFKAGLLGTPAKGSLFLPQWPPRPIQPAPQPAPLWPHPPPFLP